MNASDNDTSYIAESLPAFISEADEHIEMLEQLLLKLESDPGDRDLLDALFRSAHTIKGSAGIFGLDRIVAFTHHIETLLDLMRAGKRTLTPELGTLLLQCNDQLKLLVASVQGTQSDTDDVLRAREALVERLRAAYGEDPVQPTTAQPVALAPALTGTVRRWTIAVAFGADTYRNGMDPLAILAYLQGLGTLVEVECTAGAVPALETLDPETCHLSFTFALDTTASREQIEGAFSFVRDDCTLDIAAPDSPVSQAVAAIHGLPDTRRIGEILMGAGAITATQLDAGLQAQIQNAGPGGELPPLGTILVDKSGLNPHVLSAALKKQQQQREGSAGPAATEENRFIRVQADRLDHVINLLGELVIASAGASLLARQARQVSLIEANQLITSLVEEIRNGTLQLRMVPIGETLTRFRRVVRDTAAELGKDIALEIIGGEAELDKSVVERIADPLMHLVRNALDHGLETPEQRLAAGKPAQGRLTLSACHESGSILIRIEDDGRGIDRDKVLARAWERGLVELGVTPPDADILNLIFEPGFSTAEKVTNLSGRGVGMDVVRRNIEALRGTVSLFSVPGQGSRIEIRLPLTLAIIDGFLIGVGPSKFIFPLDAVVEVIESRPTATEMDGAGRSIVELRGQVLPVVSLRALYALPSEAPERSSVVVIQAGGRRYGVMVDTLMGQHQTVIKPLGRMFRSLRGMAGSSILGNGEVALIFDVNSLCQLAEQPTVQLRETHRLHSVSHA